MQVYLRKDIEAPLYRHHKLIVLVKLTKFTWNCLPGFQLTVRVTETLCDDYMEKVESHSVSVLNHNIVQKLSPSLTLSCPIGTFMDFTLSNARRFYSSVGNPLGRKGYSTVPLLSPGPCCWPVRSQWCRNW